MMLPLASEAQNEPGGTPVDLFSVNAIVLPEAASSPPQMPADPPIFLPLRIVTTDFRDEAPLPPVRVQLHFNWGKAPPVNVVSLIERRAASYLDFGVYDFFRDSVGLIGAAVALERAGIYLLGQLVQLQKRDVSTLKGVTLISVLQMEAVLKQLGLGFGLNLPAWNKQARLPLAV